MSRKRKSTPFEVNINISPSKKKKKSEKNACILQCTDKSAGPTTKFSETSKKSVYEAAQLRNDEEVIEIIDSFGEGVPPPEYGYHRKCYQKYAHGKLKKVKESTTCVEESQTSEEAEELATVRMSSRKKGRGGMIR